jgi:hypothetical protein
MNEWHPAPLNGDHDPKRKRTCEPTGIHTTHGMLCATVPNLTRDKQIIMDEQGKL